MSRIIRVDAEVYGELLQVAQRAERVETRRVSMSDAIGIVLEPIRVSEHRVGSAVAYTARCPRCGWTVYDPSEPKTRDMVATHECSRHH